MNTGGQHRIERMIAQHADEVLAIYQQGIDTGDATFASKAPDWPTFDSEHLREHRFVALSDDDDEVLGWVAASSRDAHAGVIGHSVYVANSARGQGVGTRLVQRLINSSEIAGISTIQSSIFPENTASLVLHRRVGFRTVAVHHRLRQHFGRWRDVVVIERGRPYVASMDLCGVR